MLLCCAHYCLWISMSSAPWSMTQAVLSLPERMPIVQTDSSNRDTTSVTQSADTTLHMEQNISQAADKMGQTVAALCNANETLTATLAATLCSVGPSEPTGCAHIAKMHPATHADCNIPRSLHAHNGSNRRSDSDCTETGYVPEQSGHMQDQQPESCMEMAGAQAAQGCVRLLSVQTEGASTVSQRVPGGGFYNSMPTLWRTQLCAKESGESSVQATSISQSNERPQAVTSIETNHLPSKPHLWHAHSSDASVTTQQIPKHTPASTINPSSWQACRSSTPVFMHWKNAESRTSGPVMQRSMQHAHAEAPEALHPLRVRKRHERAPLSPPWAGNCPKHFPLSTLQPLFSTATPERTRKARLRCSITPSRTTNSCEYSLAHATRSTQHKTDYIPGNVNQPSVFSPLTFSSSEPAAHDKWRQACAQMGKDADFEGNLEQLQQAHFTCTGECSKAHSHSHSDLLDRRVLRASEGKGACSSLQMSPSQRIRQRLHEGRYHVSEAPRHSMGQCSLAREGLIGRDLLSTNCMKSTKLPQWQCTRGGTTKPGCLLHFSVPSSGGGLKPIESQGSGCQTIWPNSSSPMACMHSEQDRNPEPQAVHCQQLHLKVASIRNLLNP
jgi:hypothetical protein